MKHSYLSFFVLITCLFGVGFFLYAEESSPKTFRLGIIGTTTSHVPAFIDSINASSTGAFEEVSVTTAYPGGMPDNPNSWDRVERFRDDAAKKGVEIVPSITALLERVDGVLLTSVDGRCHLEQAKLVIDAGKPMFIDKPIAATLADALEIRRLADLKKVPFFSASSLRYGTGFQDMRRNSAEKSILGVATWGPSPRHDKHPALVWYGIHGVEILFTIMGSGCEEVSCVMTTRADLATGVWKDGRIGTFRGSPDGKGGYGATVYTAKGGSDAGSYDGYKALAEDICRFFRTKQAPFPVEETMEIMAFMEAAESSAAENGRSVSMRSMFDRAANLKRINVALYADDQGRLLLEGREVKPEELKDTLNDLNTGTNVPTRVFVSFTAHKSVDVVTVRKTCDLFGNAVLAWFSRVEEPGQPR